MFPTYAIDQNEFNDYSDSLSVSANNLHIIKLREFISWS